MIQIFYVRKVGEKKDYELEWEQLDEQICQSNMCFNFLYPTPFVYIFLKFDGHSEEFKARRNP